MQRRETKDALGSYGPSGLQRFGGGLTPLPAQAAKLERLKIAVAPLGWDTNFSWLQSRSGMLDKRPALEYLVGIDRNTGVHAAAG